MEIPSSAAGTLKELKVKIGDKVNIGDLIAVLEGSGGAGAPAPAPVASAPAPAPAGRCTGPRRRRPRSAPCPTAALPPHEPAAPTGNLPHASPSVRKFARELGVPLEEVKGTGPKGRITQEDVQAFTKAVMTGEAQHQGAGGQGAGRRRRRGAGPAAVAEGRLHQVRPDRAQGPVAHQEDQRRQPAPQLGDDPARHQPRRCRHHRAGSLPRLQLNKENEKSGVKVTMLAFLIKACVAALKKFPDFNSSLDGDAAGAQEVLPHRLRGRHAQRPGGAGDQGRRQEGHAADQPGDGRAGQEGARRQARPGRHVGRDCFTIRSLGGIGGRYFTPIINAPEVAILGVCQQPDEAGLGRQAVPAAADAAAVAVVGPPRDRRRRRRPASTPTWAQILADFRRVLL